MIFRIRYEIAGGHVHCRLFTAKRPNTTWEKNGDLVFRKGKEFRAFYNQTQSIEFVAENDEEQFWSKLREAFKE